MTEIPNVFKENIGEKRFCILGFLISVLFRILVRHSLWQRRVVLRASILQYERQSRYWIPAFAGMTESTLLVSFHFKHFRHLEI